MCRRTSSGFTLVELMVVIAIIGVLVALLLPAVQAAREAGRRNQCTSQMKQIATACLQHEQAQGFLPTGGWGPQWAGDPDQGYSPNQPGGWLFNILPYMDQQALHDQGLNANQTGRNLTQTSQLPEFLCTSRGRASIAGVNGGYGFPYTNPSPPSPPFYNTGVGPIAGNPQPIGRSDYAANGGGVCNMCMTTAANIYPNSLSQGQSWSAQTWHDNCNDADGYKTTSNGDKLSANGTMYIHSRVQMSQITDGPSKTYLFGERYINPDYYANAAMAGTGCGDNGGWNMGYDPNTTRWASLLVYYDPTNSIGVNGGYYTSLVAPYNNVNPVTNAVTAYLYNGSPTSKITPVMRDTAGLGTCGSTSIPGGSVVIATVNPPIAKSPDSNAVANCDTNFGSAHPSSFNMVFCDGSVHAIPYTIDVMTHAFLAQRADHNVTDAGIWQASAGPPATTVIGSVAPR